MYETKCFKWKAKLRKQYEGETPKNGNRGCIDETLPVK